MSNQTPYNALQQSDLWKFVVRPTLLSIRGNKCEKCSSTNNLDVHHTDYEVQTINTLQVLCRKCHLKQDVKIPEIIKRKEKQK